MDEIKMFKLSKMMEKKKKTMKDIAEKTGLNLSYLYSIQRGESNPTIKVMKQIADALDCDVSKIL